MPKIFCNGLLFANDRFGDCNDISSDKQQILLKKLASRFNALAVDTHWIILDLGQMATRLL